MQIIYPSPSLYMHIYIYIYIHIYIYIYTYIYTYMCVCSYDSGTTPCAWIFYGTAPCSVIFNENRKESAGLLSIQGSRFQRLMSWSDSFEAVKQSDHTVSIWHISMTLSRIPTVVFEILSVAVWNHLLVFRKKKMESFACARTHQRLGQIVASTSS